MVDYDPLSEVMREDPFPVYARLRAESPVHYVERHDCWALSRFEDVWNAGADPETFMSPGPSLQNVNASADLEMDELSLSPRGSSLFTMNPPFHTELRKHLARLFSPAGVRRFEPQVRAATRECLAKALPSGRLDAISELAGQISVKVACLVTGLPLEDGDQLFSIVRRFFLREPGIEGLPPDAVAASGELREYLISAVREHRRRGSRGSAALDVYASVEVDGRPYTEEEVASHLMLLVVGGTETLPKVFAGGVLQLHRHRNQRALLLEDPSMIPAAFTEVVRYEMPTQFLPRTVRHDVELHGQRLRAGQGLLLLYRSANRDEREFDEPDRFEIRRRPPRILSFGHGTHVCLGQHAARLEARVLLEELLAAVPDHEVVEDEVVPARSEFVDGYLEMPIVFEPRG